MQILQQLASKDLHLLVGAIAWWEQLWTRRDDEHWPRRWGWISSIACRCHGTGKHWW